MLFITLHAVPTVVYPVDFGLLSLTCSWIGTMDFYTRINFIYKQIPLPSYLNYTGNNSASRLYNPSIAAQIYCPECRLWRRHYDIIKVVPDDNDKKKSGNLTSRASTWSIIRGQGWATLYPKVWRTVDSLYDPDVSTMWLTIGSYKLSKGVLNSQEQRAAATYVDVLHRTMKFFCHMCEERC